MPAQVTIQFEDTNPDGANSEDGYFVWRAIADDPVPNLSSPPATAHATVQGATSGSGGIISYVDNTILPNRQYFYRIGFYRGGGANPQPLTVSDLAIGNAIGPILVPDNDHLGYPNNSPDHNSGVANVVDTEPLYHFDARQFAIERNWDPTTVGSSSLFDMITPTVAGGTRIENKADTYSNANGNFIGDVEVTSAGNKKDLYLWHGEDPAKPLIPVLGDRNTSFNWPIQRHNSFKFHQTGLRAHFGSDGPNVESIFFDEGITFFAVSSPSGSIGSSNASRRPGNTPNYTNTAGGSAFGYATGGPVGSSLDWYWSTKQVANIDDHTASGRSSAWEHCLGGDGYNNSGLIHQSSVPNKAWTLPFTAQHAWPEEYYNTGSNPTTAPRNLSITAGIMSGYPEPGKSRLWINGGAGSQNDNPIVKTEWNQVQFTNNSGNVTGPMPNFNADLGFDGAHRVTAEILFFPKALSVAEFSAVTSYLQSRWSDYLNPQGMYNNKLT